jgi:hypothetical protein
VWLPTDLDGRTLGLEVRRFLCAALGLKDPLAEPGEATGGTLKTTFETVKPPQPEEHEDHG